MSREGDPVTANDLREIGVGMLGYAFMGKAHSNAFRKIGYMTWPPPLLPRLVAVSGRDGGGGARGGGRHGFDRRAKPGGGSAAGSGALGDLAAHVVDLARYLVGEIEAVGGFVRTFIPGREVDDAVEATVEFENGTVGTIEATRLALGRRNAFQWEINGSKGSLAFDMERLNELQVFRADGDRARGFKRVLVSEADHPFWQHWWPPGHIIGWGETFVHELHHLLRAIAGDGGVAPYGATFEGGHRAAQGCDAIVRSGETGERVQLAYRST